MSSKILIAHDERTCQCSTCTWKKLGSPNNSIKSFKISKGCSGWIVFVVATVTCATFLATFGMTVVYSTTQTSRTRFPRGWDRLSYEISKGNLWQVTIVNDDSVELDFSHCPIFEQETLDVKDSSLDAACSCNKTYSTAEPDQDDPYDLSKKVEKWNCTMWQSISLPKAFTDQLKDIQKKLGRDKKQFAALFHRYETPQHTRLITLSVLWPLLLIEVLGFAYFVSFMDRSGYR